jgi:hypothetical protein
MILADGKQAGQRKRPDCSVKFASSSCARASLAPYRVEREYAKPARQMFGSLVR